MDILRREEVLRMLQKERKAMPNIAPKAPVRDIIPNIEACITHPDEEFTILSHCQPVVLLKDLG